MPSRAKYKSIEVRADVHERLRRARYHHRQSYGELIRFMLDWWEREYPKGPWKGLQRP